MVDATPLIAVCASAQLTEGGSGFRFAIEAGDETVNAFVVRYHGTAYGYLNRCAHVAMELDWLAGQFFDSDGETLICATHGAVYDPASGGCIGGPCAGRGGLRRLQVSEDGGVVYWRPEPGLRPLRNPFGGD